VRVCAEANKTRSKLSSQGLSSRCISWETMTRGPNKPVVCGGETERPDLMNKGKMQQVQVQGGGCWLGGRVRRMEG
jgi:hypothetical protein